MMCLALELEPIGGRRGPKLVFSLACSLNVAVMSPALELEPIGESEAEGGEGEGGGGGGSPPPAGSGTSCPAASFPAFSELRPKENDCKTLADGSEKVRVAFKTRDGRH